MYLEDRIAILIARKLSGEATSAEIKELQEHLLLHPEEQYLNELLSDYWEHPTFSDVAESVGPSHFDKILAASGEEKKPPIDKKTKLISFKWLSVAAATIGAIAAGYFLWSKDGVDKKLVAATRNEVVARKGTRTKLVLPDGSTVWLNSESHLSYSNNFNDSLREVELDGEAYFDVVKNPKRPFIVHTSGINVRVLGTAFNVKSYEAESFIEATLIHGMIEVSRKDQPKSPKIILHPHEKLVFEKGSNLLTKANPAADESKGLFVSTLPANISDTAIIETAWIYNKLLFEGDTFKELAVKMERWFNVKIRFENERVANFRFRGAFEKENITQALEALQLTAPFKYSITGNEITINKK